MNISSRVLALLPVKWVKAHPLRAVISTFLLILAVGIVANGLVITNYGKELDYFGIKHSTVRPVTDFGNETERYILMPQYQVLSRTGYDRYNTESPYGEDIRSLVSMPIRDAYMVFKPNYWGFLVLPPDMALSFHQLFLIAAFFVGYTLLFRKFGVSLPVAALLTAAFYFSPFLQYWWHYFLGLVAYFPWIILAAVHAKRFVAGLGLFCTATAWLIVNLYPPLIIPMGLTGAVSILVLLGWREFVSRIPVFALAGALSLALVWLYLRDALAAVQATSYPGDRIAHGGEATNFLVWWNQFIPTILTQGGRSTNGIEAPEATGAGSVLFLTMALMLDYRHLLDEQQAPVRRILALPVVLLLCMWAWIIVPMPAWVGTPLLFDRVSPRRMVFGAGVLMALIAAILLSRARFEITWRRVGLVTVVVLVSWVSVDIHKMSAKILSFATFLDLALVGLVVAQKIYSDRTARSDLNLVIVGAALLNAAAFGGFYGITSARPIFNPGDYTAKPSLDRLAASSPEGIVAIAGERVNGAILNGLGYRSMAHAFLLPKPAFLRPYFPDVSDEDFAYAFNRQSVLRLTDDAELRAPGLGVMVPVTAFPPSDIRKVAIDSLSDVPSDLSESGGFDVRRHGKRIVISGWARFENLSEDQVLHIATSASLTGATYYYAASPIPGDQMLGGFVVWAEMTGMPAGATADIAVWSQDPAMGNYRLSGPGQIPAN